MGWLAIEMGVFMCSTSNCALSRYALVASLLGLMLAILFLLLRERQQLLQDLHYQISLDAHRIESPQFYIVFGRYQMIQELFQDQTINESIARRVKLELREKFSIPTRATAEQNITSDVYPWTKLLEAIDQSLSPELPVPAF